MSLIPHTFFPRSMFDMDLWHRPFEMGPSALDVFDPFDDFDRQMNANINWLTRPDMAFGGQQQQQQQPRVPQKYRVTVDCAGFDPRSIRTEIRGQQLVVSGNEGTPGQTGTADDFMHRSFQKTFNLPKNVDMARMTSFMTNRGQLVVDVPYMTNDAMLMQEAMPHVVKDAHGHDQVRLDLTLPDSIDPTKVQVTAKDRDIIVKAEDKRQDKNNFSQFYYYRRSTMPPDTDMSGLKCVYDHHKMNITAPVSAGHAALGHHREKPIAIEHHK